MSNITTTVNNVNNIANYDENDFHLINALKNSLYPGAKDDSVKMVLSYCKSIKVDPMLKPVHIVPMPVNEKMCDVIMPGIGLSRIQAARTGVYAGANPPEYGPIIETMLGTQKISYPEWCRFTVKKVVQGFLAEFTAEVRWIESYAVRKRGFLEPNAMWKKRPYGQLAKCAEAAALKMAFPDTISQQPTADEMEGQTFMERESKEIKQYKTPTEAMNAMLDNHPLLQEEEPQIIEENVNYTLETLHELIGTYDVRDDKIGEMCSKVGKSTIEEFDDQEIERAIKAIKKKYEQKE